jgi:uncharacterized protein (TIGR02453 family)
MKTAEEFDGFPREGVKFLRDLSRNNNREWFNKHKTVYEKSLVTPAKNFVTAMGDRLKEISPKIVANPAMNQSLFRLNRDTRFSADKTPYKTHLSIFFWEGAGKRMENPGFYLCFDAKTLTLAGGAHEFSKEKLERFRNAVDRDKSGKALDEVVKKLRKKGIEVKGAHYKRVPRGFDPDHPRAELLKYNGLYIMSETKIPPDIHSKKFTAYCFKGFKKMDPVQRWIVKYL